MLFFNDTIFFPGKFNTLTLIQWLGWAGVFYMYKKKTLVKEIIIRGIMFFRDEIGREIFFELTFDGYCNK